MDTSTIVFLLFLFYGLPALLTFHLVGRNKKSYQSLPEGKQYADFWARVGAGILDIFILGVGYAIIESIVFGNEVSTYYEQSLEVAGQSLLLSVLVSWLYFCLLQSSKYQATYGMRVLGIKIYDEKFNSVEFWRLTGRYFSTSLSALILFIGFFMIGWTQRKQGLHDIVARTIHLRKQ